MCARLLAAVLRRFMVVRDAKGLGGVLRNMDEKKLAPMESRTNQQFGMNSSY
jgi:hypothetical protein